MRARSTIGCVLAVALTAACTGSATITIGVTTPVVYQEPPSPRVERIVERPGFVWFPGRWEWRGNHWVWLGGRWEPARDGYAWQPGAWTRRGNSWHWIEGRWLGATATANARVVETLPADGTPSLPRTPLRAALYPTTSPPPVRAEVAGPARPGFVFVGGRWDWRAGEWMWLDGHWEAEHPHERWTPGRWQLSGTYYVWIEGGWGRM